MEKNKIISLSTTLLYSFVLVISFLCFYHSIVESSWLLEIIVSLFVLIGVIFGYFHFKSDDQENLSQYKTIVGTIKNVGDETLLIETNDHQKYLISIAGAIESNKGLIKGNRIYIYYDPKFFRNMIIEVFHQKFII